MLAPPPLGLRTWQTANRRQRSGTDRPFDQLVSVPADTPLSSERSEYDIPFINSARRDGKIRVMWLYSSIHSSGRRGTKDHRKTSPRMIPTASPAPPIAIPRTTASHIDIGFAAHGGSTTTDVATTVLERASSLPSVVVKLSSHCLLLSSHMIADSNSASSQGLSAPEHWAWTSLGSAANMATIAALETLTPHCP